MPADPQRLDVSRLVLPRRPEPATSPRLSNERPGVGEDEPVSPDDGRVRFGGWDGFDEDAPPALGATPLPDVHLLWPLPPDTEPAPVEPAESLLRRACAAPCPGCGGELTVAVKSWCLRCGYDSDQPQRRPAAPRANGVRQAVVVLLFAVAGCLAIVAATAFRRDFVPDRTDLRAWWIGYQGAFGLLLYWVGHAVAVALTIRHWAEPQPSCFDPLAVWRYALYRLPKTRWAITYGLWGATAFGCAFVLFWMNDFAIKDKTAKQKIHSGPVAPAEPEAGSAGGTSPAGEPEGRHQGAGETPGGRQEDGAVADAPRLQFRSHKGTAVVIGYVPDPADPNKIARVVLGNRDVDGGIHFAGYAQLDQSVEGGGGLGRLRSLARPASTPGYTLSRDVIPVEPKLLAGIRYTEMDGQGIFKDTVVLKIAGGK